MPQNSNVDMIINKNKNKNYMGFVFIDYIICN